MNKHLTIKEAINERTKLENELELYTARKRMNFQKTQPSATNINEVTITKTRICFDNLAEYMQRDEEYDEKICDILEEIATLELYIAKELRRISLVQPYKIKIYNLREDTEYIKKYGEKRTFMEIGNIVGLGERQVQRIYSDIANGKY